MFDIGLSETKCLLGSLIGRESFSQAPIPAKAVQAYILIFRGVPGGAKPPAPLPVPSLRGGTHGGGGFF